LTQSFHTDHGLDAREVQECRCRDMSETKKPKEKEDKQESEKKDKVWELISDLNPY
jgi:hypothetical protein